MTCQNVESIWYLKYLEKNCKESETINKSNLQVFRLDLHNLKLHELSSSIYKLSNLEELYCGENVLTQLDTKLPKKIKIFTASNNQLSQIENSICEARGLIDLELCCNKITNINPNIRKLKKLRYLHLNQNKISTIPLELYQLKNLVNLNLSNNLLTNIPDGISTLQKLKFLLLTNNKLERIPQELYKLSNLKVLYLNNNSIKTISSDINHLRNLKRIELQNNYIDAFTEETITFLDSVKNHNYKDQKELTTLKINTGSITPIMYSMIIIKTIRYIAENKKQSEYNTINDLHGSLEKGMKREDINKILFGPKLLYNSGFTHYIQKSTINTNPCWLLNIVYSMANKRGTTNILFDVINEIITLVKNQTPIKEEMVVNYICKHYRVFAHDNWLNQICGFRVIDHVEDSLMKSKINNYVIKNFIKYLEKYGTEPVGQMYLNYLVGNFLDPPEKNTFYGMKLLRNKNAYLYVSKFTDLTMNEIFCALIIVCKNNKMIQELFEVVKYIIKHIDQGTELNEEFAANCIRDNYKIFANEAWLNRLEVELTALENNINLEKENPEENKQEEKENKQDNKQDNKQEVSQDELEQSKRIIRKFIDYIISNYSDMPVTQGEYFKNSHMDFTVDERLLYRKHIALNPLILEMLKSVKHDENIVNFIRILQGAIIRKDLLSEYTELVKQILLMIKNNEEVTYKIVTDKILHLCKLMNIQSKIIDDGNKDNSDHKLTKIIKSNEIMPNRASILFDHIIKTNSQIDKYLMNRAKHYCKLSDNDFMTELNEQYNKNPDTRRILYNKCLHATVIHSKIGENFTEVLNRIFYLCKHINDASYTDNLLNQTANHIERLHMNASIEQLIETYNTLHDFFYL